MFFIRYPSIVYTIMKKIFLAAALLFVVATETLQAQQIFQLSQYMLNDFAYNPAVAGSRDNFITKADLPQAMDRYRRCAHNSICRYTWQFEPVKICGYWGIAI